MRLLGLLLLTSCVPSTYVHDAVKGCLEAQGAVVEGINGLDQACQAHSHSEAELTACRTPRDIARDGLRKQVAALNGLVKP